MSHNFNNLSLGKQPAFHDIQGFDAICVALLERVGRVQRFQINAEEMRILGNAGVAFENGVAQVATVAGNVEVWCQPAVQPTSPTGAAAAKQRHIDRSMDPLLK